MAKTEELKYCYKHPHPSVAADIVIFGYDGRDLKVLLVKRKKKEPENDSDEDTWALPGGFMKIFEDQTVAHTAARELKEETGLDISYTDLKEVHTFSKIGRDPRGRVISVAHYALVKLSKVQADTDAERAEWKSLIDHEKLDFDHDNILRAAFERLKEDIYFHPIGFDLLPEEFTLPQLQNLYESILGVKFDRRNFGNKMKHYGILVQVEDKTPRKGTRNPIKYRFDIESYNSLKSSGFRLEF